MVRSGRTTLLLRRATGRGATRSYRARGASRRPALRQAGPCRLKALGHTAFHLRRAQRAESGLGESGRLQPSAVPALGTVRKLVQNKLLPLPPPPAPVRQRCSRTGHPRLPGSDWAGCFPHLPLPHPDPARSRSNSTHLAERGRGGGRAEGTPRNPAQSSLEAEVANWKGFERGA